MSSCNRKLNQSLLFEANYADIKSIKKRKQIGAQVRKKRTVEIKRGLPLGQTSCFIFKLSVNAVKRIFYKKMSHAPAYIAKNRTRFSIFVFCLPNKELTILTVVPEVAFGLWLDLGIVIKRQAIRHILLAFRHRHLRHRLRRTAVIYCSTHLRLKNKKMESLFVSLKRIKPSKLSNGL